jgi:hypothetical protein
MNLPRLALVPMHAIVNVIRAPQPTQKTPRIAMTGGRSLFSPGANRRNIYSPPAKICSGFLVFRDAETTVSPLLLPPKVPPFLVLQYVERLSQRLCFC